MLNYRSGERGMENAYYALGMVPILFSYFKIYLFVCLFVCLFILRCILI